MLVCVPHGVASRINGTFHWLHSVAGRIQRVNLITRKTSHDSRFIA